MRSRVGGVATRVALVVMGAFTAVPVLALFQPEQLESYGIVDPEPMVLTLLQHRGVSSCWRVLRWCGPHSGAMYGFRSRRV
ncbi:hypothetical protein E1218_01505 [Kribbella turkmenica]|uniref:Uncharacterized protein n=1 Tax=Kribbella turkmenica TaxID=2530375 RepID=A0A4R4XHP1_9ACTN|nr:hypothetical protein [Kribbella turkmenica]TDD30501.1 hypothetical protein E1218_01505 [Kribbella turkmenica]